jgi:hypothetical protein
MEIYLHKKAVKEKRRIVETQQTAQRFPKQPTVS